MSKTITLNETFKGFDLNANCISPVIGSGRVKTFKGFFIMSYSTRSDFFRTPKISKIIKQLFAWI